MVYREKPMPTDSISRIEILGATRDRPGFAQICSLFFILLMLTASAVAESPRTKKVLKVGHFPNLTHAQAVVAHAMSRAGQGWFEPRLGENVEIRWYVYNAGPSAMEAVLARTLDMTFVGPSPTINAFLRSEGKQIRVVAGACSGGAALVIRSNSTITSVHDFKGKRVLTPQFGNTQDVAARKWFIDNGYEVRTTGGDVIVVPTPNPIQIDLFRRAQADAAWTVEPWVSRLELETGAKVFLEETSLWSNTGGKYVTTHLVASTESLKRDPELVARFVRAHIELTDWIKANAPRAKELLLAELRAETGFELPRAVLDRAWDRLEFTYDPVPASLRKNAYDAYECGLIDRVPDLTGLYELKYLNEALEERGLPIVTP